MMLTVPNYDVLWFEAADVPAVLLLTNYSNADITAV